MTDLTVTTTRVIAAPAQKVFDAWLDPVMLAKFMRPMPEMPEPRVTNDPVEGGRFDIVMMAEETEIPHAGTYTQISPYSRLVFTWESPFPVEGSMVTLDFEEVDAGTSLVLTHIKFPSDESRDNHNAGWEQIIRTLESVLV